jgi:hypothetical protein
MGVKGRGLSLDTYSLLRDGQETERHAALTKTSQLETIELHPAVVSVRKIHIFD